MLLDPLGFHHQAAHQCAVLFPVPLPVHQQAETFFETETVKAGLLELLAEGVGHSVQTHYLSLELNRFAVRREG